MRTLTVGLAALACSLLIPAACASAQASSAPREKLPCTEVAVTTLPPRVAPPEAVIDSVQHATKCRRVQWHRRGFLVPVTAEDSLEDAHLERIQWASLPLPSVGADTLRLRLSRPL